MIPREGIVYKPLMSPEEHLEELIKIQDYDILVENISDMFTARNLRQPETKTHIVRLLLLCKKEEGIDVFSGMADGHEDEYSTLYRGGRCYAIVDCILHQSALQGGSHKVQVFINTMKEELTKKLMMEEVEDIVHRIWEMFNPGGFVSNPVLDSVVPQLSQYSDYRRGVILRLAFPQVKTGCKRLDGRTVRGWKGISLRSKEV